MSDAGWYYSQNGQPVGPVSLQQVQSCLASGVISPTDLVWREGFAQWVPAGTVPELAGAMPTPPGGPQPYVIGYGAPATQIGYAGFWKRFAAYIIDWIIIQVPSFIIGFIVGIVLGMLGTVDDSTLDAVFELIGNGVGLVVGWLYYALMESSRCQGTVGKLALGIKVTDLEGNPIGFGRATGRFFGKIISALILLIGFIMAGFTERKQALHDIMAGCLVVNRR